MQKHTVKPAIQAFQYEAWFWVMTRHKSNLEFVLDSADDRNYQYRYGQSMNTRYVDQLWRMLNKEFEKNQSISVVEVSEYGDVSFRVCANTPEVLQKALMRCDRVVARWINRYRINSMKEVETS